MSDPWTVASGDRPKRCNWAIGIVRALDDNAPYIWALTKRNVAGRYRNSSLGFLWGTLTPVLLLVAIYVTFSSIKAIRLDVNYWVYLSIGIFAMTCCTYCLRGRSFYNNSTFIKKMAIPKWAVVVSDSLAQFLTMVNAFIILLIAYIVTGFPLHWSIILFLPMEILLLFVFCLGISFIVSTLSVVHPDVGHAMSIVSRLIIWLTPVFFFIDECNDLLRTITLINPFTYYVESMHQTIFFGRIPDLQFFGTSLAIAAVALVIGWFVFSHYEKRLAEML